MPDDAQARSKIREILAEAGHRPNRAYGQNFLADPNIVAKIVTLADVEDGNVVEIGAGTGAITSVLAKSAKRVVAYEIDDMLVEILEENFGGTQNVEIRHADAATVDLVKDLPEGTWSMVSNLPYNVGTGIVLDSLRSAPNIERFAVMVQREVGERMLATPGSKTYGLPSVIVGLYARGRVAMTVPPQVFEPPPRVESVVVILDRIAAQPESERAVAVAATAFNQRRKMLRRSLAGFFENPAAVLELAGVDPSARPEDLAPLDYVAIARSGGAA